jgi:type IV pilus assembly protein PilV
MLKPAVALRHCPSALAQRSKQGGIALIEALVATLLLMLGILALIGLQGRLVGASTDAQLRGEATFLADQIISQMWIEDPDNLKGYATSNGACSNAHCNDWMTLVNQTLPAGTANITVNNANVQVSVLWMTPDNLQRQVQVSSVIQNNYPPTP